MYRVVPPVMLTAAIDIYKGDSVAFLSLVKRLVNMPFL